MRRNNDGRAYVRVSENTADLIAGEIDPVDWDDEELLRGYSRAKDGSFRGRPPSLVPIGVYQEFVKRQLQRAEQGFVENVAKTVEAVAAIAKDPDVDESTRLKAAEMIWDRVWGKAKSRVELTGAPDPKEAYEQVIDAVTLDRSLPAGEDEDEDDGDVVDAEVVEDDEPEPEPRPGTDAEDWTPTYSNEEDDDEFIFD